MKETTATKQHCDCEMTCAMYYYTKIQQIFRNLMIFSTCFNTWASNRKTAHSSCFYLRFCKTKLMILSHSDCSSKFLRSWANFKECLNSMVSLESESSPCHCFVLCYLMCCIIHWLCNSRFTSSKMGNLGWILDELNHWTTIYKD